MTTVAIVGTAGRRDAATRLTYPLWLGMVREAERFLAGLPRPWDLVSGGAAWSDHVAVRLFLDGKADSLTLYLPCRFDLDVPWFEETSEDRHVNYSEEGTETVGSEARVANFYHRRFSGVLRRDRTETTLHELAEAIRRGARVIVGEGFKSRNYGVGHTEALLAFTFGEGKVPADGGTAHTWRTSAAPLKVHVPLGTLLEEQAGRLL